MSYNGKTVCFNDNSIIFEVWGTDTIWVDRYNKHTSPTKRMTPQRAIVVGTMLVNSKCPTPFFKGLNREQKYDLGALILNYAEKALKGLMDRQAYATRY